MFHPQRSPLEIARLEYQPQLSPFIHSTLLRGWSPADCNLTVCSSVRALFPHLEDTSAYGVVESDKERNSTACRPMRCGVVFSGGPAAGGHNVLWGIYTALRTWHPESILVGFLNGPGGILAGQSRVLGEPEINAYRNQGGFDSLGSGRTKIETSEQMDIALAVCEKMHLDGLVIVGGDDSNTNAALLAERALTQGLPLRVIGIPKTIDGDLKNLYQPISFGFDTATKVYSESIGNIARDAASSRKYTHFIKLMGRSASHVTLECALQARPNLVFLGEEIAAQKITLTGIVDQIVEWFISRSQAGNPYGVILIPEGLVEFLFDMGFLIQSLNRIVVDQPGISSELVERALSDQQVLLWRLLPEEIKKALLADRDPHGNVPLSAIETEKLLALLVAQQLRARGVFNFNPVFHFLGYEGRCALPTDFDATYCYSLGWLAATQVIHGLTGTLTSIRNPEEDPQKWMPMAIPLVRLMNIEERGGKKKPVITKALVDLEGIPFRILSELRENWAQTDSFQQPGPVQFFGEERLTWRPPLTLMSSL